MVGWVRPQPGFPYLHRCLVCLPLVLLERERLMQKPGNLHDDGESAAQWAIL